MLKESRTASVFAEIPDSRLLLGPGLDVETTLQLYYFSEELISVFEMTSR